VVSLDDIRIRGRWSLRLIRTTLAALGSRRRRRCALCSLHILLLLSRKASHATSLLARELSTVGLAANGAVAWLSMSAGLLVCDDVVGGAAFGALAIGNLLVLIVCLGVLEDDVPGMEEAGEEAETAERNVYERVGAADALLHPDCAES
jgi:fatty acid desaturase